MKTIDEFGSVLVLAALVLGACAAVDGLLLPAAAGGAGPAPAHVAYGQAKFMAVVHRDRVVLADHSRMESVTAKAGEAAPADLSPQTRLSW